MCTICQHPQRQDIDRALLAGNVTLINLGQQYNLSKSALHRHKQHLLKKMQQVETSLKNNIRFGCFAKLITFLEMAMRAAQTAAAEGNSKLVLQAISQGTRIITIVNKMDFQPDLPMVYALLTSPQWGVSDSLLPEASQALTVSNQALAADLFSPCPDPASEPPDLDIHDNLPESEEIEETRDALLRTQNSGLRTSLQRREKSGKLPGKSPVREVNTKKNQKVVLCEKNAGKIPAPARCETGSRQPETEKSPLEALFDKWGITAEFAANDPILSNIVKNYQEIMFLEKNVLEQLHQEAAGSI